jgi:hypothetical protein
VNPWRPVNGLPPRHPPRRKLHLKIALRTAYAVATPFHIESWPARVLRNGTFATAVIAIA